MSKTYKHPVCKGSMFLGTACAACERCIDEVKSYTPHDQRPQYIMRDISTEDLKAELVRRRKIDNARKHIKSAEDTLARAQQRLKLYQGILDEA